MNETVQALVSAIAEGDAIATEQAFGAAMAEKLASRIDDLRTNIAQGMFSQMQPQPELAEEEYEAAASDQMVEASLATDAGLQTRMDKNFTKSVATRYDGTRKQEADGKKAMVKTSKIMKSRGIDAKAAKSAASDKNDYENEM